MGGERDTGSSRQRRRKAGRDTEAARANQQSLGCEATMTRPQVPSPPRSPAWSWGGHQRQRPRQPLCDWRTNQPGGAEIEESFIESSGLAKEAPELSPKQSAVAGPAVPTPDWGQSCRARAPG